jgi:predicted nucleic acid-binding protein
VIVVDASVLANALTDDGSIGSSPRTELARDAHWTAPEHVVVEVFSAIRGRWLSQKITERRARDALDALGSARIDFVPTTPLLARMWQLRENVSGYDAGYLATAEIYECPLVTSDDRLAHVPNLRCEIWVALPAE